MATTKFSKSSIGRKVFMALTGFFLMFFLLQHLTINMLSVISPDMFNDVSHFMGTNPIVQIALQPVLMFAVVAHFIMGIVLDIKNRNAREVSYVKNNANANSTWMSRNMIISGLTILAFLVLHFIDFWIPEMNVKYVEGDMSGLINPSDPESGFRYYEELRHKFVDVWRVIAYIVAFVLLALHLQHGFSSAFQSVGARNNNNKTKLQQFGNAFAVLVPLGFVAIALFHFFTQSH